MAIRRLRSWRPARRVTAKMTWLAGVFARYSPARRRRWSGADGVPELRAPAHPDLVVEHRRGPQIDAGLPGSCLHLVYDFQTI